MHDFNTTHFHEPQEGQNAGSGTFSRAKLAYDQFMESEGVPIYRGIGVKRVQDIPMLPWKRLGGRGSYIQLYGTEGLWGSYVVEVPAGGALNVEKHMFEKTVLVVEGRGSTEVWQNDPSRAQTFEWQRGSLFTIPLNASHRFVNATNSPAIILCGTSAPPIMNHFNNIDFVFNSDYVFNDRMGNNGQYFKENEDIEPDPVRGLAMRRTNFISDAANCELPLDNRRSPGYRRIEPEFGGSRFYCWIGQHDSGRYSKAHKHESSAVLICLKGKGYTYTWHDSLGQTPWKDGLGDKVLRQEYEFGGMVSAAPMNGDWFHQHFGMSKEPLRLTAWFGVNNHYAKRAGRLDEELKDYGALDLKHGGTAIPYSDEDPYIRQEFEAALAAEGVESRMKPEFYEPKE